MELNVNEWKEFNIPRLFDVEPGQYHYSDEYEDGDTPYVSASDTNNGIGSYISLLPDFDGNKITEIAVNDGESVDLSGIDCTATSRMHFVPQAMSMF